MVLSEFLADGAFLGSPAEVRCTAFAFAAARICRSSSSNVVGSTTRPLSQAATRSRMAGTCVGYGKLTKGAWL